MLIAGPGITRNSTAMGIVGSHIDLAPTWMELAGVSRPAWMDGRSIAGLLLGRGSDDRDGGARTVAASTQGVSTAASSQAAVGRPANAAYIEYHGLGPVGAPRRLLDSFNNTFRGVRLVGGAGTGPRFNNTPNLLYAEWGSDFSFSGIAYRELYDMDADPWQMTNLYDNWSRNHSRAHLVHQLANLTRRLYSCSGVGCL